MAVLVGLDGVVGAVNKVMPPVPAMTFATGPVATTVTGVMELTEIAVNWDGT
jgi:hypothetical protein